MFWVVTEVQVLNNGQKAALVTCFDNEDDAFAKFYTIGAAAAKSGLPYHGFWIVRSDGRMRECKVFDRRPGVLNDG